MNPPELLIEERKGRGGDIGIITLNRPQALNALSFSMCRDLCLLLSTWAKKPSIKAVIIKGAGERAFCAGGDIRSLYHNRFKSPEKKRLFFWHEYRLNLAVHHFPKPYIAFLDGITMGGGAGVSIHGSHRIATEHLNFAMPETKIGFYPDIGASYFLSQCPGKIGLYLALTGNCINAAQAHQLNLVTHCAYRHTLPDIEAALINTRFSSMQPHIVTQLLDTFHTPIPELDKNFPESLINTCFNFDTLGSVLDALKKENTQISCAILDTLNQRAPTSLKVTFARMHRANTLTFNETMQLDFDTTQHFLESHDFYEGIRTVLIDKGTQPIWKPSRLSAVTPRQVKEYLSHQGILLDPC